jgi:hypothetical protein
VVILARDLAMSLAQNIVRSVSTKNYHVDTKYKSSALNPVA